MAIITYHSLEDKNVKQSFNHLSTSSIPIDVPIIDESIEYELVNKHPIVPSDEEVKNNNRARSAKLRVIVCVNKERG
jgi:16S rRNA (cytosine1402-N4)-methyltransferase